jgi:ABC transporter substrate binding protein (PQQ-dependent alcohol dehydrogenase system)
MRPEDYNAWMALRAIGEAATRTQSGEFETLRDYMLGDEFALAIFKGVAANFRDWDNQLRQPVLLAADRVMVSVSPQDQYVHQVSPLDSLGTDRPETECRFE